MADEDDKDAIGASEATAEASVKEAEAVVDAVSEDEGVSPEEGIADLRKSIEDQRRMLEEERQRRILAEQAAYQARVQAVNNDQQLRASHYHEVNTRINFANEREKALMAEWTEAKSMGDYAKEAEIQKALIQNSNDLRMLSQAKDKLEQILRQPVQPVPEPQISIAEAWARECGPSDAAWLRSHEDKITNDRVANRVRAYHEEALEQGIQQSTPEYYRFIEERAGWRRPARRDEYEDEDEAPRTRRSAPPPSAPVSRGGDRKGTFRLSQQEREIAQLTGQTEEQYYRNKMRDQKRAGER